MKKHFLIYMCFILGIFSVSYAETIAGTTKINVQESMVSPRVVFQYDAGEKFEYIDNLNNEWLKVLYDENKYGYVNAKQFPQLQPGFNSATIPTKIDQKSAGQAIANFAIDAVSNHKSEFIYSYGNNGSYVGNGRQQAYLGNKTSGTAYGTSKINGTYSYTNKYSVDCVGFVSFVIRHSLHIGGQTFTRFVTSNTGAVSGNGFSNITGLSASQLMPGDIIYRTGHVMIYVGRDTSGEYVIAHAVVGSYPDHWGIAFGKLSKNGVYNVGRITESAASKITSVTTSM